MANDIQNAASQYVPNNDETYEQWFDRQVELGLAEADDSRTVWANNDEVFRQVDQRLDSMSHRKAS